MSMIWLFDLDNTLHDASRAVFWRLNGSMTDYIAQHLDMPRDEADRLRIHYWRRYGATLLGISWRRPMCCPAWRRSCTCPRPIARP